MNMLRAGLIALLLAAAGLGSTAANAHDRVGLHVDINLAGHYHIGDRHHRFRSYHPGWRHPHYRGHHHYRHGPVYVVPRHSYARHYYHPHYHYRGDHRYCRHWH